MIKRKQTNRVIFHHSLSTRGDADTIRGWHLSRGFSDIGYHYVILKDGTIEDGRDYKLQGAHAYGKNRDSIGVCLIGDFRKEAPTRLQLEACARLYHSTSRLYGKNLKIGFHRTIEVWNPCPGKGLCRKCFINELNEVRPY